MANIKFEKETAAIFAAGLAIGKFGKTILGGATAKDLYVRGVVGVLKAKDVVANRKSIIEENIQDIYAEAKQIKADEEFADELYAEEEVYEDLSDIDEELTTEETEEFDKVEDFTEEI